MGILDDDIQHVRQASDIVEVISEHVALKRVGRRWQGLCPFHQEKSPSFSVNQELGLYKCFGCGVGGDVITFVQEIEHVDFPGAVERLANRAGVTLRYTDRHEGESRQRKAKLIEAVAKAVAFYHERLLKADDAGKARGYLRQRGLGREAVDAYQLGWAPDGWDTLTKALRLPNDVLVDAGLGFLNSRQGQTDAFRGRIMFPIFDVSGDPVGFGGRILPGVDGPKYKNSSESLLYAKSKLLYGLNWAKAAIVAADQVVVCEGYTDVIGLAAAGVPQAVATCGTSLTEDHVRILKSFAHRVVLAFDADAAGQNAAERFYEWEKRYDVDVAVAAMPAGVDPADLSRQDPEAMREAIEQAVPFLQFRVNRVLTSMPMTTVEGTARAAEAALAVVRAHPNELVRDQYLMQVASRTGLEPDRLRARLDQPAEAASDADRRRRRQDDRRPVTVGGGGGDRGPTVAPNVARGALTALGPEIEALGLLVERGPEMASLLHESLFESADHREAYRLLLHHDDPRQAIDAADDRITDLLQRAVLLESDADPIDVAVRLHQVAARRALAVIDLQVRQAADPLALSQQTTWLMQRLAELEDPDRRLEAAHQLLAWREEGSGREDELPEGTR